MVLLPKHVVQNPAMTVNCEEAERCVICKGDHSIYSRSCPNWIREEKKPSCMITQKCLTLKFRKLLNLAPHLLGYLTL